MIPSLLLGARSPRPPERWCGAAAGVVFTSAVRGIALLLFLVPAGCSDSGADRAAIPTLLLEQDLLIDGHEHDLAPIAWILIPGADLIAVAQAQAGAILFFGPDADAVGSVGRVGEGPGEFQAMSIAGLVGDTLWVLDRRLGRMSFVSPELEVSRTERWLPGEGATLTTPSGTTRYISTTPTAVYADGSFHALMESEEALRLPLPDDFQVPHGIIGPDRVVRRVVSEHDFGRSRFQIVHAGGELHASAPFPILPLHATAQDGSSTALLEVAVDGEHAGTFLLTRFDAAGDTVYSRRYPFEPVPIPSAVADSAIEARVEEVEQFVPAMAGEYRSRIWIPPVHPPVEEVVIGRDGSAWIRWRTTPERGSHYLVLDPRGVPIGETFLPENVQIRVADMDAAWALLTDDLGVQSIVGYRVSGIE